MSLIRLAEAMDQIADEAETKEIDQVLSDFGNEDEAPASTEEDDEAIVARLASATDDFEISGINSGDQDEFSQVQTVGLGGQDKADFGSVAEAAKKYAFCARKLASLEVEAKKDPSAKKYLAAIASMSRILEKKAAALKVAIADKTTFSGDLGHDGVRPEAEYGAYDTSKPAMDAEVQSTSAPWKTDKHDEMGYGIPKEQGEVTREAASKTAANQSIRLAVCLLGSKAPEDMIQAQASEFFSQMKLASIERAIKRVAETENLYKTDSTAVNPEVVTAGPVTTVEEAANEISANAETPACEPAKEEVPASEPVVAEVTPCADADFSEDEQKKVEEMTAAIVARQAKIREAAIAKAKAIIASQEEIPEVAPVTPAVVEEAPVAEPVVAAPVEEAGDEIAEAVAPEATPVVAEEIPEAAPEAEPEAEDMEIDFSAPASDDAESIPELEASLSDVPAAVKPVVASKTEKPKFVQKLGGTPRLASKTDAKADFTDLRNLWVKPGEEFFA